MAGHNKERSCLKGVRTTNAVERVLDVVGSGRDNHSGLLEGSDGRETSWRRVWMIATLQKQVGLRERHDTDAGFCNLRRYRSLSGGVLHPECDAVAGGYSMREAGLDYPPGQRPQEQHFGVEHLVDVKIDGKPGFGGDGEHVVDESGAVRVKVGTSADKVDTGFQRRHQRSPVASAIGSGHWAVGQSNQLHIDQSGHCICGLADRKDS